MLKTLLIYVHLKITFKVKASPFKRYSFILRTVSFCIAHVDRNYFLHLLSSYLFIFLKIPSNLYFLKNTPINNPLSKKFLFFSYITPPYFYKNENCSFSILLFFTSCKIKQSFPPLKNLIKTLLINKM